MPEYIGPIQFRRDTSSNWAALNPVLASGELGLDLTAMRIKVGNGADSWSELPFSTPDSQTIAQLQELAETVEGAVTPTDAVVAAAVASPSSATAQALYTKIAAVGVVVLLHDGSSYPPRPPEAKVALFVGPDDPVEDMQAFVDEWVETQ